MKLCGTDKLYQFYALIKGKEDCECCIGYRMLIVGAVAGFLIGLII